MRLASVSSVSRARSTPPIDSKSSTTLGGPIRASARCLSSPAAGVADLMIASAAASWNLRVALSRPAALPLRRIPASASWNARAASGAPSRSSHCQIGSSDVRRIWPDPDRKIALDEKRLKRTVTAAAPGRRCAGAHVVFVGAANDLAKLLEHEIGDGHVFAALDGALELPHQQRLRLRRELGEIVPQPLGRCLAHSPGVDMRVMWSGHNTRR